MHRRRLLHLMYGDTLEVPNGTQEGIVGLLCGLEGLSSISGINFSEYHHNCWHPARFLPLKMCCALRRVILRAVNVWAAMQEDVFDLPALCECEEGFSCINDDDTCLASPTAEEFPSLEGELFREIVTPADGGDPVLVVVVEHSLYMMTSSTIFEFEYAQDLVDNDSVPIRFFNFQDNVGGQATTSEGWDEQPTDWISVFPLSLDNEENATRRVRRLAIPPPGSCEAFAVEEDLCDVQDNGATKIANGCANFVLVCGPVKLANNPVIAVVDKMCSYIEADCKEVEQKMCSDERAGERQETLGCCDLPVRRTNRIGYLQPVASFF